MFRILTCLVILALAGCADPNAANEKNFKAVIQQYLDSVYPKCYLNVELPQTVDIDFHGTIPKLRALAKVGLVSESKGVAKSPWGVAMPAPSFELTAEGKKFYKPDAIKVSDGKHIGGFCFGKAHVREIVQFTEPSDMFGHHISRVNYTYQVSDLPAWAAATEVVSVFDTLKVDVASNKSPIKDVATLVLTNKGWVHEKLFAK